jgi:1-deoxy-D-xylulose-5-phosphate synthase
MTALPHGKASLLRRGTRIALLAFGSMLSPAMQAADEIGATLANMRYIKPLDEALVLDLARGHELIVTIEENAIMGGAGSAVNEFLAARDEKVSILNLGLPDRFEGHDSRDNLIAGCGLDPAGIVNAISERLKVQDCHRQPTRVIS